MWIVAQNEKSDIRVRIPAVFVKSIYALKEYCLKGLMNILSRQGNDMKGDYTTSKTFSLFAPFTLLVVFNFSMWDKLMTSMYISL